MPLDAIIQMCFGHHQLEIVKMIVRITCANFRRACQQMAFNWTEPNRIRIGLRIFYDWFGGDLIKVNAPVKITQLGPKGDMKLSIALVWLIPQAATNCVPSIPGCLYGSNFFCLQSKLIGVEDMV